MVGGVGVGLAVLYVVLGINAQEYTEKMSARQVARTVFYCESSGRDYKLHLNTMLWTIDSVSCE